MANDIIKVQGINSKGYGIIPKLVMQDRNLNVIAKAIYSYLCSFSGAGETCSPTRSKICYDLQMSKFYALDKNNDKDSKQQDELEEYKKLATFA